MSDDLFDARLTEHRNPRTAGIDRADPLQIVDLINAEDTRVAAAVQAEREPIARALEIAVDCFRAGGKLIYVGAGTSGRLGVLDATECPPTFGTDPKMVQGIIAGGTAALTRSQEGAEDVPEDGAAAIDARGVGPVDFVFGIATSSTTPYVRGALRRARELGARTGFLCCTEPGEEVRAAVDVCIVPLVGPEAIAGSTRMKAGTATKLVLNTITTGAMIRLGKVYGNLMVDLQAISEKLVDRSQRIIMAATERDRDEARALLEAADGSVKRAIVMDAAGVGPTLADLLLAESRGFVWRAIETGGSVRSQAGDVNPYVHYPTEPPGPEATDLLRNTLEELPLRVRRWVAAGPDTAVEEEVARLIEFDQRTHRHLAAILEREGVELPVREADRESREPEGRRSPGEATIGDLVDRLEQERRRLLEMVAALTPEDWTRTARHRTHGRISIYQILRHLARHDQNFMESIHGSWEGWR